MKRQQDSNEGAITVFFDGGCPLCRREIAWYRKLRGAESIRWTDISEISGGNVSQGLCVEDALKRFHVQLENGKIVSGATAFSAVWKKLTIFKPLGYLVGMPVIKDIAEIAYRFFLKIRPFLQRLATP